MFRVGMSLRYSHTLEYLSDSFLPQTVEDDSPYLEVRSAVSNTDDPLMPVNTVRAWVIGMLWTIVVPGVNQFLFFRFPSVTVTGVSRRCSSERLVC